MKSAPADLEPQRDTIIKSYGLSDQDGPNFDHVAELAARIMNCPVGFFSVFTEVDREVHSAYGIEQFRTPRENSVCNAAVIRGEMIVITDASKDPEWSDHPYVVGPPNLRAYVGMPIRGFGGMVIGALCVVDTSAHTWGPDDFEMMAKLGKQIEQELATRRQLINARAELERRNAADVSRLAVVAERQTDINRRILHDFRNIMAAIQANADFLPSCDDPLELVEVVQDVREACERGMSIIAELEQFSHENREFAEGLMHDTDVEIVAQ